MNHPNHPVFPMYLGNATTPSPRKEASVSAKKSGVIPAMLLSLLIFVQLYSLDAFGYTQGKEYKITILHTNDHHGRFWRNKNGEYGLPAQKTLVDEIRAQVAAEGGKVFLLSGGDINSGVPESDLQDAEPDFIGMRLLGYDAMAVGNHEFDNPLETIRKQQEWAKFPFLSANVFFGGIEEERVFEPYVILHFEDLNVAVLGLTTESTVHKFPGEDLRPIIFRSALTEARNILPKLREIADVIIAVTHLGYYEDGEAGDAEIANGTDGINVIVGGHSQQSIPMPIRVKNTFILQAGEWGKYLGRLNMTFRDGAVTVKNNDYELIPVNLKKKIPIDGKDTYVNIGNDIAEDESMLEVLRPFQERGEQLTNIKIGTSLDDFDGSRDLVRHKQAPIAQLVGQAQRTKVGTDIGIVDAGGIRSGLSTGELTYRDVLSVHPFGNTITTVSLTGDELKECFKKLIKLTDGDYTHFVNTSLNIDSTGNILSIKVNGAEISSEKKYTLSVNNFFAGTIGLKKHPTYTDSGYVDADALMEYIKSHSPVGLKDYDINPITITSYESQDHRRIKTAKGGRDENRHGRSSRSRKINARFGNFVSP